ncbi:MAG: DNA-binding protein, partial [bacterium]|nr:DNA-binding protein [bacterium]
NDKRLVANGEAKRKAPPPPLFSRKFFARLYRALDKGCISARHAAQLVETDLAGLAALLKEHGCKVPFDL